LKKSSDHVAEIAESSVTQIETHPKTSASDNSTRAPSVASDSENIIIDEKSVVISSSPKVDLKEITPPLLISNNIKNANMNVVSSASRTKHDAQSPLSFPNQLQPNTNFNGK